MNDDYDKHIIQKYNLSVALAILRDTPKDSNSKLYLEHLKSNVIPEMDPFDSDMTICEDDFEFNDNDNEAINDNANNEIKLTDSQTNDSVTILKDFDFNDMLRNMNNENNVDATENNAVSDVLRILKGGNEELEEKGVHSSNSNVNFNHMRPTHIELSQNLSQRSNVSINGNIGLIHGNKEFVLSGATDASNNKVNDLKIKKSNINFVDNAAFCDSQTKGHRHGNNPKFALPGATDDSNNKINDLKNKKTNMNFVDNAICGSQTKGHTHGNNSKLAQSGATIHDNNNKINDLKPNVNSGDINNHNTNIASVDNAIFRDSQLDTYNEYTDNFTHISQSQVNNYVLPRNLIEKDKFKDNKSKLPDIECKKNINAYNINTNANINVNVGKTLTNIINGSHSLNKIHRNSDVVIINDVIRKDNKKHKFASQDSKADGHAKRSRNVDKNAHSDTDVAYYKEMKNKSNVPSSIDSEMSLNINMKSRPNERFRNLKTNNIVNISQETNDTNDADFNSRKHDIENYNTSSSDNFESQFSMISSNPNEIAYGSQAFSHCSSDSDSDSSDVDATMTSQIVKHKFDSESSNNVDTTTSQLAKKIVETKEDSEEEIEEMLDELTDSQAEVVPFKVLEELNKVKTFLNKRNRGGNSDYASDSGYRSDSQSRSSFRSGIVANSRNTTLINFK